MTRIRALDAGTLQNLVLLLDLAWSALADCADAPGSKTREDIYAIAFALYSRE